MPLVLKLRTKSHKKAKKDLKVSSISFLLQTLLNRNSSAALKDGSFLAFYFVKGSDETTAGDPSLHVQAGHMNGHPKNGSRS